MRKSKKNLNSADFQRLYSTLWESSTKTESKVSATFLRETTRIPNLKTKEGKIE
jgi:hypothetical protein